MAGSSRKNETKVVQLGSSSFKPSKPSDIGKDGYKGYSHIPLLDPLDLKVNSTNHLRYEKEFPLGLQRRKSEIHLGQLGRDL